MLKPLSSLLIGAVILTGCATGSLEERVVSFDPATVTADQGLIVMSAGTEKTCFTSYPVTASFKNRASGKKTPAITLNSEYDKSGIEPTTGRDHTIVAVFPMKAGEYDVTFDALDKRVMYELSEDVKTEDPMASFTIDAGETDYLGELFLGGACGAFVINQTLASTDMSERDFAYPRARNPNVSLDDVRMSVLTLSAPDEVE